MFCPQCATENTWDISYCRVCGQALGDVRLAVEGIPTETLEKLKAGAKWTKGGLATLVVFALIAAIISLIGIAFGHPSLGMIAVINMLLGVLVGVPLVFAGSVSTKRATRLLSMSEAKDKNHTRKVKGSHAVLTTDLNPGPRQWIQESVTENTTLNLRKAGGNSRKTKE